MKKLAFIAALAALACLMIACDPAPPKDNSGVTPPPPPPPPGGAPAGS